MTTLIQYMYSAYILINEINYKYKCNNGLSYNIILTCQILTFLKFFPLAVKQCYFPYWYFLTFFFSILYCPPLTVISNVSSFTLSYSIVCLVLYWSQTDMRSKISAHNRDLYSRLLIKLTFSFCFVCLLLTPGDILKCREDRGMQSIERETFFFP